ncbi:MAG TPA: DUF502 domain-containing protein [Solimonas sp.]|nr:DUF502 domain-containing protein [Solimonas sp.]
MTAVLRRWVVAGLLVWIPLAATLLLIRFMIGVLDTSLLLIPQPLRPDWPGVGALISILLVIGTGALAANFVGARALGWAESLLGRIPLVRSVYGGIKKLAETIFSNTSTSFRTAVLIEYPRHGVWTVAFVTGQPLVEARDKTGQLLITVFVPTTPNPTSGFMLLVPEREVTTLDMTVEQAMRLVISLGVVAPDGPPRNAGMLPSSGEVEGRRR